jgi:hypothetical protein
VIAHQPLRDRLRAAVRCLRIAEPAKALDPAGEALMGLGAAAASLGYTPAKLCLELKSLKEYLQSYRNLGIFQENIVNQVLDDIVPVNHTAPPRQRNCPATGRRYRLFDWLA